MTKASQSFATHLKAAEIADFFSRLQAVQAQAASPKASTFASCFAQIKISFGPIVHNLISTSET